MNKAEYIKALSEELQGCPEDVRNDIIGTFEEHFTEGLSRGQSEEQITEELGSVNEVAAGIRSMAQGQDDGAEGSIGNVYEASPKPEHEETICMTPVKDGMGEDGLTGFMDAAPCLVIEAVDTGTDVLLSSGSRLEYRMEAQEGFTIGNGVFFRSPLFKKWQKAQVNFDNSDTESRISVHGAGGRLFVNVPAVVQEIRILSSSGDINIENISAERLTARTSSGDVLITECNFADARMESVSGDVKIRKVSGTAMEMYSVSGDIGAQNISGNVQGKTASGDIEIEHHETGEIVVSAKSGDIEISSMGNVSAHSVSGDISLHIAEGAAGCQGSSTSGDVKCRISGIDFTASLESVSGSVKNKTAVPDERIGKELHTGQGGTCISLKSISGDVTIQNV